MAKPTKTDLAHEIVGLEAANAGTGLEERLTVAEAVRAERVAVAEAARPSESSTETSDETAGAEPPEMPEETARDHAAGAELDRIEAPGVPEPWKWNQLRAIAAELCRAKIAPPALRDRPHDALLVLLTGHDLGIPLTQAFRTLTVIDGQLSMRAELMVALVIRGAPGATHGNRLWPDASNNDQEATAHAQRWEGDGWGPVVSATFTLDDARRAGLTGVKDGKAYSRSQNGKPLSWEKYTSAMLWARAVSKLIRQSFPDCTAGVSYVPEELGYIDVEEVGPGSPPRESDEASMTITAQRSEIARRIGDLPADLRKALATEWSRRNLSKTDQLTPGGIRQVLRLLNEVEELSKKREAEAAMHVDDAETQCQAEGCTSMTTGIYCDAHVHPQTPPVDPDRVPADGELICATCNKVIKGHAVIDDARPYHHDCAPF